MRLVGETATKQLVANLENMVFAVKRLIDLHFSDKQLQDEHKRLLYKVVLKDDHPYVQVQFKGKLTLLDRRDLADDFIRDAIDG
jgi:L1 cell adhesion molecule like protein